MYLYIFITIFECGEHRSQRRLATVGTEAEIAASWSNCANSTTREKRSNDTRQTEKKRKTEATIENGSRKIMANPTLLAVLEVHPWCDVSKYINECRIIRRRVIPPDFVRWHMIMYDHV